MVYRLLIDDNYLFNGQKRGGEYMQSTHAIMSQKELNMRLENHCLFQDVSDKWLQQKKGNVRESTFAIYYQKVHRYIIPNLGGIRVRDLTEVHLNEFLKWLSNDRGLSWKTVSDIRSVLKMILDWVAKNGCNELGSVTMYVPSPLPQTLEILTIKEQKKLEQYLLENMSEIHLGLLLSLYAGLRIGEVCGLKWGDIDFRRGTLLVCRTVMRIQETNEEAGQRTKVIITQPKTYNSNRTIPVVNDVMKYLKAFHKDSETFVLTGTSICMEPRMLTVHYKKILRTVGLSPYKYHTLRHTFATRCVEQGVDLKTLSEIMGHSSVKITMDRYFHPTMEFKKKQLGRLKLNVTTGKLKPPIEQKNPPGKGGY